MAERSLIGFVVLKRLGRSENGAPISLGRHSRIRLLNPDPRLDHFAKAQMKGEIWLRTVARAPTEIALLVRLFLTLDAILSVDREIRQCTP